MLPNQCTACITPAEVNTICTPVRGYMTVWSESSDTSDVLQTIETDMNNGSYESGNVVKAVYIGVPTEEQLQSEGTTEANGASKSQEMESVEAHGSSIFLPVGVTIAVLALAFIALFLHRRRNDDRNGPKPDRSRPLQFQSKLEAPPTIDLEDDINLLPSPEKMDMRPINETDSDSESARGSLDQMDGPFVQEDDDAPLKQVEEDLQSVESSVFSHEDESMESGSAASGLAAMGAASTLAKRMGSVGNA